jgi:hypothetical protein
LARRRKAIAPVEIRRRPSIIQFLKAYIADSAEPWTAGLERAA